MTRKEHGKEKFKNCSFETFPAAIFRVSSVFFRGSPSDRRARRQAGQVVEEWPRNDTEGTRKGKIQEL
jgi:hypothetical protein